MPEGDPFHKKYLHISVYLSIYPIVLFLWNYKYTSGNYSKNLRWQHSLGQRHAHEVLNPQSITRLGGHDKLPVWKEGNLLLPFSAPTEAKNGGSMMESRHISEILKDNSFLFSKEKQVIQPAKSGTLSKGSCSFYIFSLPQYG